MQNTLVIPSEVAEVEVGKVKRYTIELRGDDNKRVLKHYPDPSQKIKVVVPGAE